MSQFIPSFHFVPAADKLKPEWCNDAINWSWYNQDNRNLLHGKNIEDIEGFSAGEYSMDRFKKMFKSLKKGMERERMQTQTNQPNLLNPYDTTGLDWTCSPLIPVKYNSAVSLIHKIPVEISCIALDPLAAQKKEEDLNFMRNKPELEAGLQDIADRMDIGEVNLGTTQHSSIPFGDNPYGLDLNEPDELQVFVDLLYSLKVEASFETILQMFWDLKLANLVRLNEIKDQFKYGVSAHRPFGSAITGLPDITYVNPGTILGPQSDLADYSDQTHRFWIPRQPTVMELFNLFGNEICDEQTLDQIINGKGSGYCACNKKDNQPRANWATFKLDLIFCEIKTVDSVGVVQKKKSKKGFEYLTTDAEEMKTCTKKIWGQNTICFWWLRNTKHFFGIHRLPFSQRTKGTETFQNFSTNVYKSVEKSAVELAIGENIKAQIAEIKLQHAIIMSRPSGMYFNLKYLRGALSGLTDEANTYTMDQLVTLLLEKNVMIGDTEGFDGKNDGQLKPFEEIPGGLRAEVTGYMQVIAAAKVNIGQYMGINDQLTGQSATPEGLVGLQKLLINSSINAINYANYAMNVQYQKLFNNWAYVIKSAVEAGGELKKSITNMIGAAKTSLIDGLEDLQSHDMAVKIEISQREEERAEFKNEVFRLKQLGILSTADEYMLKYIQNPKDQIALLAVREKQFRKRADLQRQEDYTNQQELVKQQGDNMIATRAAETDGDLKKIYGKGEVEAKILQLANQLGLSAQQFDALSKKALQQDRNEGQTQKAIRTIQAKQAVEDQRAFTAM